MRSLPEISIAWGRTPAEPFLSIRSVTSCIIALAIVCGVPPSLRNLAKFTCFPYSRSEFRYLCIAICCSLGAATALQQMSLGILWLRQSYLILRVPSIERRAPPKIQAGMKIRGAKHRRSAHVVPDLAQTLFPTVKSAVAIPINIPPIDNCDAFNCQRCYCFVTINMYSTNSTAL
jgi:hypothetical protein